MRRVKLEEKSFRVSAHQSKSGTDPEPPLALPYLLPDEALLADCDVQPYQASGPGGQKRNRTRSAVRIVHRATGVTVVAAESRSQLDNRKTALRRLRERLALTVRDRSTLALRIRLPEVRRLLQASGPIRIREGNPLYPLMAGLALDALDVAEGRVAEAAGLLGCNTARLVAFLKRHTSLWQAANAIRARHGHPPLR